MKLTTKQLRQIIKEEMNLVMESELEHVRNDEMSVDIRKVFSSPELVENAEMLLGSAYDLNFKLYPDRRKPEEGGEIYSDDLRTMSALTDALSACDDIECAGMSETMDLHSEKMKGFTKPCKESYRYMAYYYFENY